MKMKRTSSIRVENQYTLIYDIPHSSSNEQVVRIVDITANCKLETVEIPSYIDGMPVTIIGNRAFENFSCEALIIPATVVTIEIMAFYKTNLNEIIIKGPVSSTPFGCFTESKAEKIVFERTDALECLGAYSFSKTLNLKKFECSSACTAIDSECFSFSGIHEIIGIDNVSHIDEHAFEYTNNLISFRWPGKCKIIPEHCFSNSGIQNIENIDAVTYIGSGAFYYSDIQTIKWPSKCKQIPSACFLGSKLQKIENISSVMCVQKQAFAQTSKLECFEWPVECRKIPEQCFFASGLKTITGEWNIETIEKEAFTGTNLKIIVCESECLSISNFAFGESDCHIYALSCDLVKITDDNPGSAPVPKMHIHVGFDSCLSYE